MHLGQQSDIGGFARGSSTNVETVVRRVPVIDELWSGGGQLAWWGRRVARPVSTTSGAGVVQLEVSTSCDCGCGQPVGGFCAAGCGSVGVVGGGGASR